MANPDIGIGRLIHTKRHRDAIHVAVAPVEAGEKLKPGQHIGIRDDGKAVEFFPNIGIVDPFLNVEVINPGERFYMFLYPGTITSLRHEWEHDCFKDSSSSKEPDTSKAASEKWLRDYARRVNPYIVEQEGEDAAYETLMQDMRDGTITYHGIDMHSRDELIDAEELRQHAEVILGKPISYDDFEYFSCTC